jgi:hypothetical protein
MATEENTPKGAENEETNFVPKYDVTSTERYVDSTSQKSEFDRVIEELGRICEDTLSWDILKMTRKHFGDTEEDNARKFDAFMGSYILVAATRLYDYGLTDAAFKRLEQAKTVLEAKQKLTQEVEAIRAKTKDDAFDVSDMLDLFGGDDGR